MEMTDVVTAFLVRLDHAGFRVLVLRRSDKVGSYQGRWAAISGHLEGNDPLEQALTEIREEAGVPAANLHLLATSPPIEIRDDDVGRAWRVHPFLFDVDDPDAVRLDWEHTALRWVDPESVHKLNTVPGLAAALEGLLHQWRERGGHSQAKVGNRP